MVKMLQSDVTLMVSPIAGAPELRMPPIDASCPFPLLDGAYIAELTRLILSSGSAMAGDMLAAMIPIPSTARSSQLSAPAENKGEGGFIYRSGMHNQRAVRSREVILPLNLTVVNTACRSGAHI